MKINQLLMGVSAAAVLSSVASMGMAQAISIHSQAQTQAPQVKISVQSRYDFERKISLRVRLDPARIPTEQLMEVVNALGMKDGQGVEVHSGWDALKDHDIVLGWSGGSAEIVKAQQTTNGLQLIASFKDANGNFVEPPESMLAVYDLGGRKKCFAYEEIQDAAPPMAFTLLLDRSASMTGVIEDVKRVAAQFLDIIPDTAECRVWSFSGTVIDHAFALQGRAACAPSNFDLNGVKLDGMTDLYTPLRDTYRLMNDAAYAHHQKAVIIVTDGAISDAPEVAAMRKAELLNLKGDTLTFIFWIGATDERHLAELADDYVSGSGDVAGKLAGYFSAIGQAYRKQKVLTIRDCGGSK